MPHSPVGRREFLKRAGVVGVAAASEHALAPASSAEAQIAAPIRVRKSRWRRRATPISSRPSRPSSKPSSIT